MKGVVAIAAVLIVFIATADGGNLNKHAVRVLVTLSSIQLATGGLQAPLELFATDTRGKNTTIGRSGLDGCELSMCNWSVLNVLCQPIEGNQLTETTG